MTTVHDPTRPPEQTTHDDPLDILDTVPTGVIADHPVVSLPPETEVHARLRALAVEDTAGETTLSAARLAHLDRQLETGRLWLAERAAKRITIEKFTASRGWTDERLVQAAAACAAIPRDPAWRCFADAKRAAAAAAKAERESAAKAKATAEAEAKREADAKLTDEERAENTRKDREAREAAALDNARREVGYGSWDEEAHAAAKHILSAPQIADEVVSAQVQLVVGTVSPLGRTEALRLLHLARERLDVAIAAAVKAIADTAEGAE